MTTMQRIDATIMDAYGGRIRQAQKFFGKCFDDGDCESGICVNARCQVDSMRLEIDETFQRCVEEAGTAKERTECKIKAGDRQKFTCSSPMMTKTDAVNWNLDPKGLGFGRRGNCVAKYKTCRSSGYWFDIDAPGKSGRYMANGEAECRAKFDACAQDMHCPVTRGVDYRKDSERSRAEKVFAQMLTETERFELAPDGTPHEKTVDPRTQQYKLSPGSKEATDDIQPLDVAGAGGCKPALLKRKFDTSCPQCLVDADCHGTEGQDDRVCSGGKCVSNAYCAAPEDLNASEKDRLCNHGDVKQFAEYMLSDPGYKRAGCTPAALTTKYLRTCQDSKACTRAEGVGADSKQSFETIGAKNKACAICEPTPDARRRFAQEMHADRKFAGCSAADLARKFDGTCIVSEAETDELFRTEGNTECKRRHIHHLSKKTRARLLTSVSLPRDSRILLTFG